MKMKIENNISQEILHQQEKKPKIKQAQMNSSLFLIVFSLSMFMLFLCNFLNDLSNDNL